MDRDDARIIDAFRRKYDGEAKSIEVKRSTLWERAVNCYHDKPLEVWLTFDDRHVVIERADDDTAMLAIAARPKD